MDKHIILVVHVTDRVKHVPEMQKAFTEFGCSIKTRLGLHDATKDTCSPNGIIVLEMLDQDAEVAKLEEALGKVEGVEVKKVVFDH